jgi:hypothetical protein
MTVKQYVSFLPPFVMRMIFASTGRVDVAADIFDLFLRGPKTIVGSGENNYSN